MVPQREWFEKDYYGVLGVPFNAAPKDITKAYRKLARELHPDVNPGDAVAEERFKEVASAYDVLGDEVKRSEYDQVRTVTGPAASFGGFDGGGMGTPFASEDLGGLFGNIFGGESAGRAPGPRRGDDLEASLGVSFLDGLQGMTATLTLVADALCVGCSGSGCKPGTGRTVCVACGGEGISTSNQGFFSFSKPCAKCGGKGNVPQSPCDICAGSGVSRLPKDIKVRVPAGVKDGQRVRLKGLGGPGRFGASAGDLYVNVSVATDPLFGRDGKHVTLTLPVTFAEAALGAKVEVPTPTGDIVEVDVLPGCQPGDVLTVQGCGAKSKKGDGDLLVTIQVVVPQGLTGEQREAVVALQGVLPDRVRFGRLDV